MIYFDSAATTFQKPRTVADAMRNAMATMSSPGRGGYPAAMRAAEAAFDCRTELAELYHLENPEQVAFTMNATHGLNIAIKSLVPPGGKAVISGYEHNAVTRPLAALGAQVSVAAAPLFQPAAVTAAFDRLIVPGTDAVICNHVSNVFGFVQPVEAIAAICREREVPFIIDASQSAGMLTLDMTALGAAFIAMPGHKGLYGPQGTGVLLCGKDVPVRTLLEGGTGSISIQQEMPDFLPDRLGGGHPPYARHRRAAGGGPIRPPAGAGGHLRRRAAADLPGGGGPEAAPWTAGVCPARPGGPGGGAFHCPGAHGRRGIGRGPGRPGHRRAGGPSLRAPGPPHRRDAGHRHRPAEFFPLEHAGGSIPFPSGYGGDPEVTF